MVRYLAIFAIFAAPVFAAQIEIVGNVESKCVIQTDTSGVFGSPLADTLSTVSADGGVSPVVRFDVAIGNYYYARIKHPVSFSTSPNLTDVVNWTGSAYVSNTTDAGMSAYDTSKVTYDNVTQFDLTIAGSTWFKVDSTATYGAGKAFPGGTYRAIVEAECIAK
jgi:hypothetical protein